VYYGVSGFSSQSVLSGRPYGGCAILWRSDIHANIQPISIDSRRICAVSMSSKSWNLIIVNVYMPSETSDANCNEFLYPLSLIEDFVASRTITLLSEAISMLTFVEIRTHRYI